MAGRILAVVAALFVLGCGLSGAGAAAAAKTQQAEKAEREEKRAEFILGNVIFTLFHEVGHALVSEFELPVLGREEDAVDRFATYLLTLEGDEDEESDPSTILVDAMNAWFLSSAQTELQDIEWWDEHGPDRQRAYQIACLLYGAAPEKFEKMADEIELPEERRETCQSEYENTAASWVAVVESHLLPDGKKPPKKISVAYASPGAFRAERDLLKDSGILEAIATELTTTFRLPRALRISAKRCGEANAFWDSEGAEIEICYELLREYGELYDGSHS